MTLPAGAALADSGAGCGLGSQLFKGKSGLAVHVLAATTNGSFFNQRIGITVGSLGCDATTVVDNEYQKRTFVANNMDNLAQEIAQGRGDHLASLCALMGVAEADKPAFFTLTQNHYRRLMGSDQQSPAKFLLSLNDVLLGDEILNKYAKYPATVSENTR